MENYTKENNCSLLTYSETFLQLWPEMDVLDYIDRSEKLGIFRHARIISDIGV